MESSIDIMKIVIPVDYEIVNTSIARIPSPIPDQKATEQAFFELIKNKKRAYIYQWIGHQYRDLGPIDDKESWMHKIMGKEVTVIRTRVFMGKEQEVFVAHHKVSDELKIMIYSKEMLKSEFHELLDSIEIKRDI